MEIHKTNGNNENVKTRLKYVITPLDFSSILIFSDYRSNKRAWNFFLLFINECKIDDA